MRTCTLCLRGKDESEFSPDRRSKDGRQSRCKECKSAETRTAYAVDPARKSAISKKHYHSGRGLDMRLRRKYGITSEQYAAMLSTQDSKCAICRGLPAKGECFVVDHDHATGKARGLLCRKCNSGIGLLNDDLLLVLRAASYLRASLKESAHAATPQ